MARLIAEGPPKVCAKCGERKPRREFYAQRHSNGRVYAQGYCIPCARGSQDQYKRTHPEIRKRERETRRQDPERLATHRDQQRESARRKRRRLGVPERPRRQAPLPHSAPDSAPGARLRGATEPFVAWLRTIGPNAQRIGRVTGLEPAQVRKYLDGKYRTVSLDVVEIALREAGGATGLNDLYPTIGVTCLT